MSEKDQPTLFDGLSLKPLPKLIDPDAPVCTWCGGLLPESGRCRSCDPKR